MYNFTIQKQVLYENYLLTYVIVDNEDQIRSELSVEYSMASFSLK